MLESAAKHGPAALLLHSDGQDGRDTRPPEDGDGVHRLFRPIRVGRSRRVAVFGADDVRSEDERVFGSELLAYKSLLLFYFSPDRICISLHSNKSIAKNTIGIVYNFSSAYRVVRCSDPPTIAEGAKRCVREHRYRASRTGRIRTGGRDGWPACRST